MFRHRQVGYDNVRCDVVPGGDAMCWWSPWSPPFVNRSILCSPTARVKNFARGVRIHADAAGVARPSASSARLPGL